MQDRSDGAIGLPRVLIEAVGLRCQVDTTSKSHTMENRRLTTMLGFKQGYKYRGWCRAVSTHAIRRIVNHYLFQSRIRITQVLIEYTPK